MFDLPEHLSNLNSINDSPPSNALNPEYEEAFWNFMHTDQLFENFGVSSSSTSGPSVKQEGENKVASGPTLESFIAAFANDSTSTPSATFQLPASLSATFPAESSAPTPAAMDTATILPFGVSPSEADRVTGAKKLKQMGAGAVEIEEDKRRRNTEASARFRAKKKEREQALEIRAKELENQVSRLIAEKASLENENKLLKTIVLGGQAGELSLGQLGQIANKRKRDD